MMDENLQAQLILWRQHLHEHPETGFEETATSDYVAGVLAGLGLEQGPVERGFHVPNEGAERLFCPQQRARQR